MFDVPDSAVFPTATVSLRKLAAAPDDMLTAFDEAFIELEHTRRHAGTDEAAARRQSVLELPDEKLAVVEPGAPLVTVYLAPSDALPDSHRHGIAPLCDLERFWRIWRPPVEYLDPGDRAWLAGCDEPYADAAPPVPARYTADRGWRDPRPSDLGPLTATLRQTVRVLQKDAAA
jgi:hypothetical protein